jgi:hypothetical protein
VGVCVEGERVCTSAKRECVKEGRETCCINVPFFNELKNVFFFQRLFYLQPHLAPAVYLAMHCTENFVFQEK